MTLRLLLRFHLLPWFQLWAQAARQGPVMVGVAAFLALFVAGLALSGRPLLRLPGGVLESSLVFLGLTASVAILLGLAGRGNADRWSAFFQARPRGDTVYRAYRRARALGAWVAAGLVVAGVSGPSPFALVLAVLAAPLFALAVGSFVPRGPAASRTRPSVRMPSLVAWWAREPLLYALPLGTWVPLMAWAVSGGAGFVWAEHPPVTALLLDFGWATLVALLWSEAGSRVPYAFFRLARAPFRRVLLVVLAPLVVTTLVVATVGATLSAPHDALRCAVLTVTGTAFWTMYWLRWGTANLAHLMLFITLFLVGVALELEWWPVWALVQSVGAVALAVSWGTQYYEGETDAGR